MANERSDEFFTTDANGKRTDADLHAPMLDNEDAERAVCEQAVERAIAIGMDPAFARRLYGFDQPEPPKG